MNQTRAIQSQYTVEQVAQRLDDMRKRRVWGKLVVQLQDGMMVRMTREESDLPEAQPSGR